MLPGDNVTAFRASAAGLAGSPMERQLARIIGNHLRATTGWSPSESERKSWQRSLPVLAQDLIEASLGNVEMLIAYQLPLTSKRADVVLAGVDRRTGGDAYAVVELKQWSQAELYEGSDGSFWSLGCGDVGTVEAIKSYASSLGFRVRHVQLNDQFRCGGSRKYERWVLGLPKMTGLYLRCKATRSRQLRECR